MRAFSANYFPKAICAQDMSKLARVSNFGILIDRHTLESKTICVLATRNKYFTGMNLVKVQFFIGRGQRLKDRGHQTVGHIGDALVRPRWLISFGD